MTGTDAIPTPDRRKALPSRGRVMELLHYDPETGLFHWIKRSSPRMKKYLVGEIAGRITDEGYRQLNIDGAQYPAHRVAWLIYYGNWPSLPIDHINRDKADNRIANLREATNAENKRNCHPKLGSSKYKGVSTRKRGRLTRYRARIRAGGQQIELGCFATEIEAARAYDKAAACLHGEFAVFNFSPSIG